MWEDGMFIQGSAIPPHPKGKRWQRPRILGVPSIYVYILWHRTTKFDMIKHFGRGIVLAVSHAIHPKEWGPSAPQICFFLSPVLMLTEFWPITTKFCTVTHTTRGWGTVVYGVILHIAQMRRAVCHRQLSFLFFGSNRYELKILK